MMMVVESLSDGGLVSFALTWLSAYFFSFVLDFSERLSLEDSDRTALFAVFGLAGLRESETLLAAPRPAGSGGGPGGSCTWAPVGPVGIGLLGGGGGISAAAAAAVLSASRLASSSLQLMRWALDSKFLILSLLVATLNTSS